MSKDEVSGTKEKDEATAKVPTETHKRKGKKLPGKNGMSG